MTALQVLDSTSIVLRITVAEAKTTNSSTVTVNYAVKTATNPHAPHTIITTTNDTTAVKTIATPGSGETLLIANVMIANYDTVTHIYTLDVYDSTNAVKIGGTPVTILAGKSATITAGGVGSAPISNLTEIGTRNHNDLQNIQGGASNDYYHLTSADKTDLTDGGDTTLHIHDAMLPKRVSILLDDVIYVTGAGRTLQAPGSNYMYGSIIPTTPANGDVFTTSFVIRAGTYTFAVLGHKYLNHPILKWTIDSTDITTNQDWYNASAVYNVVQTVASVTLTSGYHKLTCTVNGKNASSTNYTYELSKVSLYPATD